MVYEIRAEDVETVYHQIDDGRSMPLLYGVTVTHTPSELSITVERPRTSGLVMKCLALDAIANILEEWNWEDGL